MFSFLTWKIRIIITASSQDCCKVAWGTVNLYVLVNVVTIVIITIIIIIVIATTTTVGQAHS